MRVEGNQAESFWEDAEVISTYTRAQAIEDGVLVDLSKLSPNDTRLYKHNVACTSAVWALVEKAAKKGQSLWVTVWDICLMSIHPVKELDESTRLFKVSIPLGGKTYLLKIVCSGGDNGEPVITIMFPDED